MAAAFAICYRLFKATDINYANQCLLSADHIYSHANTAPSGNLFSGMRTCPVNGVDVFAQFNGKAVYKDFVQSYSTVEPAIDLTASSFLAFSWQVAGAPSGTP